MASARSLRLRVLALALAAVALAWLVAAGLAYVRVRHEADELLDGYLVQTAAILQARTSDDVDESELEHAPELHRYARRVVFQLWDGGRTLKLHSANAPDRRLSPRDDGFDDVTIDGRRYRVFATFDRDRRMLVQVAEERHVRDEIVAGVGRSLALPLLVALPVLAVALWLAVSTGMRPLARLSREIRARDPDNLAPMPAAPVAELGPLVDGINHLLARVRTSLEHERRFNADAAHELRTPIAGVRVQAQVARDAVDPAQRERALAQVVDGCDRASRLVGQMLTLARLDPLQVVPAERRCDLADVGREAVAQRAQQAVEREIDLGFEDTAERSSVRGEAPLLAILVGNLLDNALRYTPPGGRVVVAVRDAADGAVRLEVADTGPGIAPDARARLGERFFRPLGNDVPGSGLGLSIVRRVAELHAATLAFDDRPGGGLVVRVDLPPPSVPG